MTNNPENMPDNIWAHLDGFRTATQGCWRSSPDNLEKSTEYVRADTLPSREDIHKALNGIAKSVVEQNGKINIHVNCDEYDAMSKILNTVKGCK